MFAATESTSSLLDEIISNASSSSSGYHSQSSSSSSGESFADEFSTASAESQSLTSTSSNECDNYDHLEDLLTENFQAALCPVS